MALFYETDQNGSEIGEERSGKFVVWIHDPSTTGTARTMLRGKARFAECKTLEDAKHQAAIGQELGVDMRTDTKATATTKFKSFDERRKANGIAARNTSNRTHSRLRCLEELPNERYDSAVLQDFRKIQDLIIEFGHKLEALTTALYSP